MNSTGGDIQRLVSAFFCVMFTETWLSELIQDFALAAGWFPAVKSILRHSPVQQMAQLFVSAANVTMLL